MYNSPHDNISSWIRLSVTMRLHMQYRRKKCITDYANANCFTNADVINLVNNRQLFFDEQRNVLVPINESRMM